MNSKYGHVSREPKIDNIEYDFYEGIRWLKRNFAVFGMPLRKGQKSILFWTFSISSHFCCIPLLVW